MVALNGPRGAIPSGSAESESSHSRLIEQGAHARHLSASQPHCFPTAIQHKENPEAHVGSEISSDRRMLSRVYGEAFLLRATRARTRNLRSPRITYST
jgi:hypothetical protein